MKTTQFLYTTSFQLKTNKRKNISKYYWTHGTCAHSNIDRRYKNVDIF